METFIKWLTALILTLAPIKMQGQVDLVEAEYSYFDQAYASEISDYPVIDEYVVLSGKIISQKAGRTYVLRDRSGTIPIVLSSLLKQGVDVGERVIISGFVKVTEETEIPYLFVTKLTSVPLSDYEAIPADKEFLNYYKLE